MVNLAVALGECGKKVLVVDLDFRKPRVHRAFRLENVNGISDYLIDKIDANTFALNIWFFVTGKVCIK